MFRSPASLEVAWYAVEEHGPRVIYFTPVGDEHNLVSIKYSLTKSS